MDPSVQATPGALPDRTLLNRLLSRSVSMTNAYASPCSEDDLRMLKETGALFVGRSAYVWVTKADDAAHFSRVRSFVEQARLVLPDEAVLQAAIFEAVYPQVEEIPIPAWVFEDMQLPVEERNFRYTAMQGRVKVPPQGLERGPWKGGAVPDLACLESRLWYYYRARRYLECGYEALHLGQVHLVGGADRGHRHLVGLVRLIRRAATRHARRGWVILDGHSHGIALDGELLFDFASRPLSARTLEDHPVQIALLRRGGAIGGKHPGGWECAESPVLVEVDNCQGFALPPDPSLWANRELRAKTGRWGWDDIAWFAHLDTTDRHGFLRYAYRWARLQGPEWHFQMPMTRSLGLADIERPDAAPIHYYRANRHSPACPDAFGDEAAIRDTWTEPLADTGAKKDGGQDRTPSGLTVPEPVTVGGSIQPLLGGIPGDAACPWSRLYAQGNGRFSRVFCIPLAGEFDMTITCGGTFTDPVRQGGIAGGASFRVVVPETGTLMRIDFDYESKAVRVVAVASGESMLKD